ncbi:MULTISPECIES: GNAT family N-acetyltransferase [Halorussus]|uniref:GNAT family N-acetyltransferase n=1 Tax=Halorussus TaxID=1070314 RepID=UPI000E211E9F|nr:MULTISPECIES: GNAT family N-acetyltransferase [Halorussus]NHN60409.1 GNAT family N-acetyltransferase [Halorussus sp. JP-T4]
MDVSVREATDGDRLDVRRVLDAAMLRIRVDLAERVGAGDVLVAVEAGGGGGEDDGGEDGDRSVLGALVLVSGGDGTDERTGAHIDAVAVRRARRGQGIGSALVRAAAERRGVVTAEFDPDVRPFYEALDFDISRVDGDENEDGSRLWGRYDGTADPS